MIKKFIQPKRILSLAMWGALAISGGAAVAETGSIKIGKAEFAQNNGIEDTTSTEFATVPEMEVSFKAPKRAIIRFCANGNMFGTGTGSVQVAAQVDGTQVGDNIQLFTADDSVVKPRCYEWVTGDLGKGVHTAKIVWRVTLGGGSALTGRFHDSILTVLH